MSARRTERSRRMQLLPEPRRGPHHERLIERLTLNTFATGMAAYVKGFRMPASH